MHLDTFSLPFETVFGGPTGMCFRTFVFNIFINNLCNVIRYSKYLLFADYINIFRALHSVDDRILPQSATESEQGWCAANCMKLNNGR
jgi:hypothetical protein